MQILAVSTSDIESFIASGQVYEYRFGVISNTDNGDRKIAQAGANARVAGIIAEDGVVGESTAVITTKGRRYMLQVDGSAVAIAPGDLLKSNGIGRGVKAGPGDCYGARAYGSATTAGAVIEVEIEFGVIPGPGAQSITGDATLTAASFQNTGALTVWIANTDAAVNLTLPASTGLSQGTRLRVEKTTAAAYGATITRGGTDTIAGATTFTHIAAQGEFVVLELCGTDWRIVGARVGSVVNGSATLATTLTANQVNLNEETTVVLANTAGVALNLPASGATLQGRKVRVIKTGGGTNAVTVTPSAGDTVNGGATHNAIDANNDWAVFQLIGTNWRIVDSAIA